MRYSTVREAAVLPRRPVWIAGLLLLLATEIDFNISSELFSLITTDNGEEIEINSVSEISKIQDTSRRKKEISESFVYWTVHHLDGWIKRDQLDVTCFYFIISRSIKKQVTSSWSLVIQLSRKEVSRAKEIQLFSKGVKDRLTFLYPEESSF